MIQDRKEEQSTPMGSAFASVYLLADLVNKALLSGRAFDFEITEESFHLTLKPIVSVDAPLGRPAGVV